MISPAFNGRSRFTELVSNLSYLYARTDPLSGTPVTSTSSTPSSPTSASHSSRCPRYTLYATSRVLQSWKASPYLKPIALFIIAELLYLLFATIAWLIVLSLPEPTTGLVASLMRGIFSVALIGWQTVSLIPVLGVIDFVYSSEWAFIYHRDCGQFLPGRTDMVSNLTSGWLRRARHTTSRRSSVVCRLAFLAALMCTALAGVGPSALSIQPWRAVENGHMEVANITLVGDLESGGLDSPAALASEHASKYIIWSMSKAKSYTTPRDFDPQAGFWAGEQPNTVQVLVPWPSDPAMQSLPPHVNVTYMSDVIQYRHSCQWHEPTWNASHKSKSAVLDGVSDWTVTALPGHRWRPWMPSGVPSDTMSGIFPLTEPATSDISESGLSAFLWIGFNGTSESLPKRTVRLFDVPAMYRPDGFPISLPLGPSVNASAKDDHAKFASILVCNPLMFLKYVRVTVQPTAGLFVDFEIDEADNQHKGDFFGDLLARNISPAAAATIFSQAWSFALQMVDEDMPATAFLNLAAGTLFSDDSLNKRIVEASSSATFVIEQHLDTFMLYAASAYMSGYTGPNSPATTYSAPCLRTTEEERVTVNPPFFVATVILVVTIAGLLSVAANLPSAKNREPLSMEALLKLRDSEMAGDSQEDSDQDEAAENE